jgi:oligoendopeptidase F
MSRQIPFSPQDLLTLTWSQIEPVAKELVERPVSAANAESWLLDWSDLSRAVSEAYKRRYVASTVDTTDPLVHEQHTAYLDHIHPPWLEMEQKLKKKLIASGLQPKGLEIPLRNMRAEAALYQEENLSLLSEDLKLGIEYDQIIGDQTVTWEGQEVTLMQLYPVLLEADRHKRERSWRLAAERRLKDRPALNDLWARFMDVRQQTALNASLPDFRAYKWQQLLRFDYTPQDCASFHKAIEEVVVPAASRLYEKRRQKLGFASLRPWDLDVDLYGQEPLRPYQVNQELIDKTATIFTQVDPQLGDYYNIMRREGLLDLENRKGKAPGGYCESFDLARRPFIFMNGVGIHDDVMTLLHEGGHAFHVFETAHLPYHSQTQITNEIAEVASMSMELLASPYITEDQGGFYSQKDAARARLTHLEQIILFWPYMAVIDAFQHWTYENSAIASDPARCETQFVKIWQRFMPGIDWSGLEDSLLTRWHRQGHIFQAPFYYVEYGLAQLGAVQIWRNALKNQSKAVVDYRKALALGGTASLPQLFKTAGAKFAFDAATLRQAVALIESTMQKLEESLVA